jgi:serine/threonine-protein kinase
MTTLVAPYKVVSALKAPPGLQLSQAQDGAGVAIWLYTHDEASPAVSQRMLEAAKACRPDGPWLQVLDAGVDGPRAWAVTLPFEGPTLAQLIARKGALDAPEVMAAVIPVCAALGGLAAAGHLAAVRSDLVLVDAKGAGRLVGFSPDNKSTDARTQVRALGALMYEALTGSPPPDGPVELVGVRPPLSELVPACLNGELLSPIDVLDHLRRAGKGDTVDVKKDGVAVAVHDTRVSGSSTTQPGVSTERAGEVIGSYELVRRLGEGGMGEVYLARHQRLGREVALKVLRADMAKDPEMVRRFFNEARVVNEINHPHIVEVIDFAEEPGRAYCVMELLKGVTLETILREEGSLSVARTCDIMAQVCEALAAAHKAGVVHRDVKPANIFLTEREGRKDFVKVLDFGVARVARADGSRTMVGAVLGTPAYMSPEQAQGKVVDGRSDVYSAGAVMYELLSGRVLSTETFTPPPLVDTGRGEPVPGPLAELVQGCLQMNPADRPASALEVAQRLARAIPRAVASDTQRLLVDAGLKAESKPSRAPLFVAAVLLLGGAGTTAWYLTGEEPKVEPVVQAPPVKPPSDEHPLAPVPVDPAPSKPPAETPKPAPAPIVSRHAGKKPPAPAPAPTVTTVVVQAPPAEGAEYGPRMRALQKEYDGLVARYGVNQLTAIEREVVRQALEDYAGNKFDALKGSLVDAEVALKAAHHRLDR